LRRALARLKVGVVKKEIADWRGKLKYYFLFPLSAFGFNIPDIWGSKIKKKNYY